MAVSVVHFNTNSPHKVLQQNTTNNNNSNDRRDIIILRKNPHILPQPKDYNKEDILITNPGRKKPKSGKEIRTQPQPVAVARRNARERNRVKQVNNGFANLRQRIPNFIASTFESSTRGGSKKLSKVETLRMAVEYIRSLEDVLAMDGDNLTGENGNISNSSNLSSPSFSSSLNTLPSYPLLSPSCDSDDLSSTSTPPPPHYIRIDTATNTYQLISGHHPHHNLIYNNSAGNHNNENLDPISDDIIMSDPSLIDADFGAQDLSLLNSMHGGDGSDSLSPGMYSEQSLSPALLLDNKHDNQQNYIAVFHDQNGDFKVEHIKSEVIDTEVPVISLKTENELPQEHKDNVIDVMQWWEHQAPNDTLS